ncbi:MAG: AAA family ATPase [Bryobacterales bacterium]|nr:AAA family ATPase [Bryobacterales bacterium]
MATHLFDFVREMPPWLVLGLGVLAGGLRSIWYFVYQHTIGYAITRVSISLTVEDVEHRDAYLWLSCWVEQHLRGRKVNSLLLRANHRERPSHATEDPSFDMIPEYGSYYLLYRHRLMMVEHRKEQNPDLHRGRPMHTIRIQVWLCWDRTLLMDILREAENDYESRQSKRLEYFRANSYGDWTGALIAPRPLDSIFHPPELLDGLIDDVGAFLDSRQVYQELGVPYRRGYLLTGPPGTGKSTLILAIASHFNLPVYKLPLNGAEMTGDLLSSLLVACRKPAVLALEDVDCLKVATSRSSEVSDGLTLSDLLNAVDGIGASEDRLLFMTANQPDRLDAALIRAGRVDRKVFVDFARDQELRRFHERLASMRPVPPWPEFRAALPAQATIADAQAFAFRWNATAHSPLPLRPCG